MEPTARTAYEAQTGNILQPLVVQDGLYSASLDCITLDQELILEIKCPVRGTRSDLWQDVAVGVVPEHYRIQVMHRLPAQKA